MIYFIYGILGLTFFGSYGFGVYFAGEHIDGITRWVLPILWATINTFLVSLAVCDLPSGYAGTGNKGGSRR